MPEQDQDQDNQFHVYVIVWMTPNESNPSERQISSISLHSNPEQARDYLKERIELLTDIPARSEAPSNGWENPIRAQKILLATNGTINDWLEKGDGPWANDNTLHLSAQNPRWAKGLKEIAKAKHDGKPVLIHNGFKPTTEESNIEPAPRMTANVLPETADEPQPTLPIEVLDQAFLKPKI